ncbi:hypothetical protein JTB14_037054 [Gonioctena quinquepunctata]|nr:hypothetical protein JTB14_037054 [Gonioctena quinquepunctata]
MNEEGDYKTDIVDVSHIKNEKNREVKKLIEEYNSEKVMDTDVKMKIILKDGEPVYQTPRRLAEPERGEIEKQIEEWLEEGIRRSSSDFASPKVLVKKKMAAQGYLVTIENSTRIVKNRFPLPLIEDVLDRSQGANYFSTTDLRNGFFNVGIEEDSILHLSHITHNLNF